MKILKLVLCLAIPLIIGSLSGIATAKGVSGWYQTITKPSFNPPNFVFAPVWTTLYILMGVSLYMLLNAQQSDMRTRALVLFGTQLLLNFIWSFLFFYFESPGLAFIEIGILWATIAAMIFTMIKVQPLIGYLQVPYLLWVSFASVLNGSIWWLNR